MQSPTGGSGEVHAHLSSMPDKGEGMSGKFHDSHHGEHSAGFADRVRERADDAWDAARERGEHLRERLGDAAHRARSRADHLLDETEDTIDEHTGVFSSARQSPLAALGIAFAIGFLLAGDSDAPQRHPAITKAKNQVKGAIVGGISAALSQQLRTFIEEQGGVGTLLAALGVPLPGGRAEPDFTPDDELPDA